MHVTQRLLFGVLCIIKVLHAQDAPGVEKTDSVQILAVSPGPEVELHEARRIRFDITIHYSLHSVDHAILQVYAERYASSSRPCDQAGVHQTEGGTVAPIKRGDGDIKVSFAWKEGTGPDAKVPRGAAFLAFGINLWTEMDGRPVKPMIQAFGTSL